MSPLRIPIPNRRPPLLWLLCALTCLLPGNAQAAPLTAHALPLAGLVRADGGPFPGQLSPDGRRLAYFVTERPNRLGLRVYDLKAASVWVADLEPMKSEDFSPAGDVLTWRPDSRACAVGVRDGWAVVSPGRKRVHWVDRSQGTGGFECCAAWSPRSGRLAVFSGGGTFRVWDGTRLRRKADWAEASGAPSYATERAWQCEWSPDEKSLLLRFYGQSARDSSGAGHLMILAPGTGRQKFDYGTEAGRAHWLDDSRIAFRGDGAGTGGLFPTVLTVARPASGQERPWRTGVVDWALSPRRDTAWIVTDEGDVWRTPLVKPHWRRVGHSEAARKRIQGDDTVGLCLSPDGREAALTTGSAVGLIPSGGGPIRQWREGGSDISVLGWVAGRSLPLLAVSRAGGDTCRVCQMEQQ